jgi:hypothetical protein
MGARILNVPPNPPRNRKKTDNTDDEVEAMEPGLEHFILVPLFT